MQYTIYYLGPEEDDLEDARRLLNVKMNANMTKRSGHTLIQVPIPSTTSAVPINVGDSLPLVARSIQWARFANPNVRQPQTGTGTGGPPVKHPPTPLSKSDGILDQVTEFLGRPSEKKMKENLQRNSYQHWEANLTRWSRVVLGQLAFPLQQARKVEAKLRKSKSDVNLLRNSMDDNVSNLQRAFVTTTPGMTRILEASAVSMLPMERLVVRMVPMSTPALPLAVMDCVPQLEIVIRLHAKERATSLVAARLVLVHGELDLLLPSHRTDLRFVRRLYLYSNQEQNDPRLTDFINASNLDIWGSERLRTPNDLQLLIPACSILGTGEDESVPVSGLLPVDYKFAGLEHRSNLNLPLVGSSRPQYTTIEAGRTGGRREELAINLGPDVHSSFRRDENVPMEGPGHEKKWLLTHKQSARSLLEAASTMIRIIETDEQGPRSWADV